MRIRLWYVTKARRGFGEGQENRWEYGGQERSLRFCRASQHSAQARACKRKETDFARTKEHQLRNKEQCLLTASGVRGFGPSIG